MSQGVRKGSIFSFIGYGFAGLFLALFHAFAGRWLGVEHYGLLNTLLSYINITTALVVIGITEFLSRYISFYEARSDKEKETETIQTSFIIYLILLSIVFIFSLILKKQILKNYFNNNVIIFYQFLLGIISLSLFYFYNGLLRGYRKFRIFSIGNGFQGFLMLCFLFIFIKLLRLNETSAGWCIAVASILIIIFYQPFIKNASFWTFKDKKTFSGEIIKFIFAATFISLMNMWLFRAGPILLKTVGGSEADKLVGLFSAMVMPLNLARFIIISLEAGFYPNLSRAYSIEDKNLIKRYIFKSFGVVIPIILFTLLIYSLFGPKLVLLIYKEEYAVSRIDTILLAFVYSFYFLGLHLARIMMARNTPGYSSLSLGLGIVGMFVVIIWFELPPLRLVEISLLACNFLYFSIQGLLFLIIKTKKYKETHNI